MANRFNNPVPQYLDNSGNVLAGGKLYLYESASNTFKTLFNASNKQTQIANPVVFDASGRTPEIFFEGTARAILTNSDDVQIWDRDPVNSENLQVNLSLWSAAIAYEQFDFVRGSDGNYYQSKTNDNLNNDPTISPNNDPNWEQIFFNEVWNNQTNYSADDLVWDDAIQYRSLVDGNIGNEPSTSTSQWELTVPPPPELKNSDWEAVQTSSFTLVKGNKYPIDASAGAVDATLPGTLEVGDPFVVRNNSNSTNTVRVVNAGYTIRGRESTATASDNIVIEAGTTRALIAVTTTVLEIY
jgi:hypothetical protein